MKLQRRVRGWTPVTSKDGASTVGRQRRQTSWGVRGARRELTVSADGALKNRCESNIAMEVCV